MNKKKRNRRAGNEECECGCIETTNELNTPTDLTENESEREGKINCMD